MKASSEEIYGKSTQET